MTWRSLQLSVLLVALLSSAASEAAEPERGCVTIHPNASFDGTGYAHYAMVRNSCDRAVRCELWTDVDATPLALHVAAGDDAELTFRRGSPASAFRAFARCTFR
jgi:hypothetical protein